MKYVGLLCTLAILLRAAAIAQSPEGDNLEVTGIPAIPQRLIERSMHYQNIRSASISNWDVRNNGMYISTRFANTTQIHHVTKPGGMRTQLTFFHEPVSGLSVDPREGRDGFAFTRDDGGAEFYQIYYFDTHSGKTKLLSDGRSRHSGASWSKNGSLIAFSSNRRNGRDMDVWIMNPDNPSDAWLLTESVGSWNPSAWSPDGEQLVVTRYVSVNKSLPYIVNLVDKEMTPMFPYDVGDISYANFNWSPDAATIYYTSDRDGEFNLLYAYDAHSGESRLLTPALRWSVERLRLSEDGSWLAYTVNEDGMSRLRIFRMPDMTPFEFDPLPTGVIGALRFSPDGDRLALNLNTAISPSDVYVLSLLDGTLTRWTHSELGGMHADDFVAPTLVLYPTFDEVNGEQRTIPAFFYMPRSSNGKIPVIINIHGGPEGQSRPSFSSTTQYWVNELGCAVVEPNVRGSAGYGRTYLALDDGYNREHSVRDIGALLDWITAHPGLDEDRVAVIGASYGGYMVLASMMHYPEQIACGVNVVGISNFVTFLQNTQSYRRDLRRVEYGDERDPLMREFLIGISPTTNAANIRAPMFVAHGENDPRVPASEARQIVEALRGNGVPVWTMFAKDEGHGFRKKHNRDYFNWSTILFFEAYLLNRGTIPDYDE